MSELEQGIAAARAGRRAEARERLTRAVQSDERNEQAWLWLSGVLDDPEDMRVCLENVLELNPANSRAQQGLRWIDERYGPRTSAPAPAAPALTQPIPAPAQTIPAPALAAQPAPVGLSSTHTTMNLDAHLGAAALAAPPSPPLVEPPAPGISLSAADSGPRQLLRADALPPVTLPCPYCGATTTLADSSCPKCRKSMMERTDIPDKRTVATTILAVLWFLGGLSTVLIMLWVVSIMRDMAPLIRQGGGRAAGASAGGFLAIVLATLFQFAMGYGFWVRQRWAYIVHAVLTGLGFIINILQLVVGATLFAAVLSLVSSGRGGTTPLPSQQTNAMAGMGTAALLCTLILVLLPVLLTVLSYRDFFGKKARIDTDVRPALDPRINYNNGLALKSKGMWYLAAREWEAALAKAPTDVQSLHALALAYAQLKQFDQARTTIQRAINVAPDNSALQESRALIDQLALKGS